MAAVCALIFDRAVGQRVGARSESPWRARAVLESQRFGLAGVGGRAGRAVDAVVRVGSAGGGDFVRRVGRGRADGEGVRAAEIQLAVGADLRADSILD